MTRRKPTPSPPDRIAPLRRRVNALEASRLDDAARYAKVGERLDMLAKRVTDLELRVATLETRQPLPDPVRPKDGERPTVNRYEWCSGCHAVMTCQLVAASAECAAIRCCHAAPPPAAAPLAAPAKPEPPRVKWCSSDPAEPPKGEAVAPCVAVEDGTCSWVEGKPFACDGLLGPRNEATGTGCVNYEPLPPAHVFPCDGCALDGTPCAQPRSAKTYVDGKLATCAARIPAPPSGEPTRHPGPGCPTCPNAGRCDEPDVECPPKPTRVERTDEELAAVDRHAQEAARSIFDGPQAARRAIYSAGRSDGASGALDEVERAIRCHTLGWHKNAVATVMSAVATVRAGRGKERS